MREIKYRFYPKTEFVKMYDVFYLDFVEKEVIVGDPSIKIEEIIDAQYQTVNGVPTFRFGFDEGFLMQFTDLKDKNGVEICQDDIRVFRGHLCIVAWYGYKWVLERSFINSKGEPNTEAVDLDSHNVEMSVHKGNIHEHPELLTNPQT